VDLAASHGWDMVLGRAAFTEGPALRVTLIGGGQRRLDRALCDRNRVGAVGPADRRAHRVRVLTSTSAMDLDRLPSSMIIVGAGAEQAQLFARLGTTVTLVETLDRIAPFEEPRSRPRWPTPSPPRASPCLPASPLQRCLEPIAATWSRWQTAAVKRP